MLFPEPVKMDQDFMPHILNYKKNPKSETNPNDQNRKHRPWQQAISPLTTHQLVFLCAFVPLWLF
jgi:hypothetical protein